MAIGGTRKRPHDGAGRPAAVSMKRRKQMAAAYHSESEESGDEQQPEAQAQDGDGEGEGEDFAPVDLDEDNDSDDIHNAVADDGASSAGSQDEGSSSEGEDAAPRKQLKKKGKKGAKDDKGEDGGGDSEGGEGDGDEEEGDDDDEDDDDDDYGSDDSDGLASSRTKSSSKRNDPSAFATSLSKILSTKLTTAKRADPVLARSTAAAESARAIVDSTLETRARRQIREHKRLALEKGRVRDVLVGAVATGKHTKEEATPEGGAAAVQETERRLRKTAQKGVVKLFNAVRAAQVAAGEAERTNRKTGVLGMGKREAKVQEMTKKGFLDLIASGGGGGGGGGKAQRKGVMEEA